MTPTTAANVERYLFECGGWCSVASLMARWNLSERGLRRFLECVHVAGEKGYIHVAHATAAELEAYCNREKAHAVRKLRNLRTLRLNHRTRRVPPPPASDADWPEYKSTLERDFAETEKTPTIQPELLP